METILVKKCIPIPEEERRGVGTDVDGRAFPPKVVDAVWEKARPMPNYDARTWRMDRCGYPINRYHYCNFTTNHGWVIDHIRPVVLGGTDDMENLQPLSWKTNRAKGDVYPWECSRL